MKCEECEHEGFCICELKKCESILDAIFQIVDDVMRRLEDERPVAA